MELEQRFAHLVVCEYCDSSIILDADAARISGKMAALAPPGGLLFVGAQGEALGREFRVIGRVRYGYGAGYWDEWFLAFDDGTPAWISEDEDRLVIENPLDLGSLSFTWDSVSPGDRVPLLDRMFQVDEKDVATCEGGEGQLPFAIVQAEQVPFLDLSNGDQFATLEFEPDGVRVFLGRRLAREELALVTTREEAGIGVGFGEAAAGTRERVVKGEGASLAVKCERCASPLDVPDPGQQRIECPSCGHELDLAKRRVDCTGCGKTVAVAGGADARSCVCPHCRSYLDIRGDASIVLSNLQDRRRPSVPFALGDRAILEKVGHSVVGHLRMVGTREHYHVNEFLLRADTGRYRWLVMEDGHFSLKDELDERPPVDAKALGTRQTFQCDGRTWTVYEAGRGGEKVDWVDGELPWVASAGDTGAYMDAISPPFLLTAEWTATEMEWYRSRYLPRAEVAAAFRMEEWKLPKAQGIGANQPFERTEDDWKTAGIVGAFAALHLLGAMVAPGAGSEVARFPTRTALLSAKEHVAGSFEVPSSSTVMRVRAKLPVAAAATLNSLGVVVKDPAGKPLFRQTKSLRAGKTLELVFRAPKAGTHQVALTYGGSPVQGALAEKSLDVVVESGLVLARWFWISAILLLGWLAFWVSLPMQFEAARWAQEED